SLKFVDTHNHSLQLYHKFNPMAINLLAVIPLAGTVYQKRTPVVLLTNTFVDGNVSINCKSGYL
ncbi:MAG TPA: hypothetical protein VM012_09665, partial [Flavitalea sp.]|nr:hypothetical protein [Flavitalea sp.]